MRKVKSSYLPFTCPWYGLLAKHSFKPVRGNDVYRGSECVLIATAVQGLHAASLLGYQRALMLWVGSVSFGRHELLINYRKDEQMC